LKGISPSTFNINYYILCVLRGDKNLDLKNVYIGANYCSSHQMGVIQIELSKSIYVKIPINLKIPQNEMWDSESRKQAWHDRFNCNPSFFFSTSLSKKETTIKRKKCKLFKAANSYVHRLGLLFFWWWFQSTCFLFLKEDFFSKILLIVG
jgi:hypothetical protein